MRIGLRKRGLAAAAVVLAFATAAFAQHHDSRVRDMTREEVAELPSYEFEGKDVFVIGDSGPPVLLLHELPGLTRHTFWLAEALASEGFTVHAPLLFGQAGHRATKMNAFLITVNGDWKPLRSARTAPIAGFLRRLADDIHGRNSAPMAVIGMCLTGNLPVALLDRDYVRAAVLSQPSLPRCPGKDADLALDRSDVQRAKDRGLKLLGFRFTNDSISPQAKMKAFIEAIPSLDFEELPSPSDDAHSVLTTELFDDDGMMRVDHPSRRAYDKVVAYLREAMGNEVAHDGQ